MPMMSAGIMSGVNWIRLKFHPSTPASVLTSSVLPRPGTPTISTWPWLKIAASSCRTMSSCPSTTLPISPLSLRKPACASASNFTSPSRNDSPVCIHAPSQVGNRPQAHQARPPAAPSRGANAFAMKRPLKNNPAPRRSQSFQKPQRWELATCAGGGCIADLVAGRIGPMYSLATFGLL